MSRPALGVSMVVAAIILSAGASAMPLAPAGPAPDFTLKTVDGVSVSLRQHRGTIVVLNFWATWCPPCRLEIPILMQLQAAYGRRRVVVLGVAMDEEAAKTVAPFVRRERFALGRGMAPMNYPVLLGTDAVADAYHVEGLPMTVLIDAAGRDVRRIDSAIEWTDLDRSIRSLLGGTSAPSTRPLAAR